jgi:hypothetical protein
MIVVNLSPARIALPASKTGSVKQSRPSIRCDTISTLVAKNVHGVEDSLLQRAKLIPMSQ